MGNEQTVALKGLWLKFHYLPEQSSCDCKGSKHTKEKKTTHKKPTKVTAKTPKKERYTVAKQESKTGCSPRADSLP